MILIILDIIIILLIGFSRMYLGMHSVDEVWLGFCCGTYAILIYRLYLNLFFTKLLKNELKEKSNLFLGISLIITIVILIIPIGIFVFENS